MSSPQRVVPQLLVVVGLALAGSVALEGLYRNKVPFGAWFTQFPLAVLANGLLAVLATLLVWAVVGRALMAVLISTTFFLVLGLAHASTLGALGRPLYPWDLFLFREAWDVVPFVTQRFGAWPLVLGGVALFAALGASAKFGPKAIGWKWRVGFVALFAVVFAALMPEPGLRLRPLGVRYVFWNQLENYEQNGLLCAFLFNLPAASVQRPSGYTREAVRAVVSRAPMEPASPRADRPDVIVLMSESLFDPTRLPGVTFERDPLPNLHRLQRDAGSGALYAPVFGGGTANTEFEMLTGHATRFLPPGSVPYQQYVRRKQASLASLFGAAGYRTAAVHLYHRWFWERDRVYEHLGFQHFVSMEGVDLTGKKTFYPPDAFLTREVIKEFDASPEPLFLFAVSIEAHGPYEPGRYPDADVKFDGPLDADARAELTTYVEAITRADRELGALVDFLEKRGRPAMLVTFGDHLPLLPKVLKQTGVAETIEGISRLDLQRRPFLYEVPLVVWSSTTPGRRDLGRLSPSFLGPLLLREAGVPGSPYMNFLQTLHLQLPVATPHLVSDANGVMHEETPEALRALEADWWTLEYDALFGDNYLEEG